MAADIPLSRSVRIADLSPDRKRRLWSWIQANDAPMADWIRSADVAAITAKFPGTSPVLDIDYVRRACA